MFAQPRCVKSVLHISYWVGDTLPSPKKRKGGSLQHLVWLNYSCLGTLLELPGEVLSSVSHTGQMRVLTVLWPQSPVESLPSSHLQGWNISPFISSSVSRREGVMGMKELQFNLRFFVFLSFVSKHMRFPFYHSEYEFTSMGLQ